MIDPQEKSASGAHNDGLTTPTAPNQVDAFLAQVSPANASASCGRLIFALDATASRQPTWDTALQLQADMFREAAAIGGLSVRSPITAACPNAGPRAGCRRPRAWRR